ncbi:MAG: HD domain-containing protein [Candidatus Paceibacterota bacterium]|jgi:uncharacterized protein
MNKKIEKFAKEKLGREVAAGVDHFRRVFSICQKLAKLAKIKYDKEVLYAACFLHDLEDESGAPHNIVAAKIAEKFLKKIKFPANKIKAVQETIREHIPTGKPKTKEAILLHDADLLDFLGATGIVRLSIASWDWMGKSSLKEFIPVYKNFRKICYKNLVLKKSKEIAKAKIKFMDSAIKELENELSKTS